MDYTLFYWCRPCKHNFTERAPDPTWTARCPTCHKDTEAYAVDEAANDAMVFDDKLELKDDVQISDKEE